MDRERIEAINRLLGVKHFMLSRFAEEQKEIVYKGREVRIDIPGKTRIIMVYGEENAVAPAYFDIHGGGYAWGTIRDGDAWCTLLAEELGYHVFSLDYPLSPETEYPGQLEYVYQTISYIREHAAEFHIDPDHLLIGGRSAGGNLAAALCLYAAAQNEFSFEAQVLDHPWLDLCEEISWGDRCNKEGVLPKELMQMLAYGYTDASNWRNYLVSPIRAESELLKQLPKTVIQTAENDSLELEGRKYAEKLMACGVPVTFRCAPGVSHGFTETYSPEGEEGREWLLNTLRDL